MSDAQPRSPWRTVRFAAFLLAFLLYIRFVLDPRLLYYGHGLTVFPIFSWAPEFLREHLAYPGGPAEWLAAFTSQAYYSPWLGALALTVLTALISLSTERYFARLAGRPLSGFRFVPALAILAHSSYFGHDPATHLGILAALCGAVAYGRFRACTEGRRALALLAISVPVYYFAGGPFLVFALLCVLIEAATGTKLPGLVAVLAGMGVPHLLGTRALQLELWDAFGRCLPINPGVERWFGATLTLLALCLCIPMCAFAVVLVQVARRRRLAAAKGSAGSRTRRPRAPSRRDAAPRPSAIARAWASAIRGRAALAARALLLFGTAALVAHLTYNTPRHAVYRINFRAQRGEWAELLREARKMQPEHVHEIVMNDVNRALYETGSLLDEMFEWPQSLDALIVGTGWLRRDVGQVVPAESYKERQKQYFLVGDADLQLGLLNDAEHMAHERLESDGDQPIVLKRLATVNIAKRQPEAARAFLNVLSSQIRHGRWAKDKLEGLAADPSAAADPEIAQLRSVMLLESRTDLSSSLEKRLRALLDRNAANRMAFDYIMASYLLTRQLDKLVAELPNLDPATYPKLPAHIAEAILVHERKTGSRVALGEYAIDPRTREIERAFRRELASLGSYIDPLEARKRLAPEYGNTYFFYSVFGLSGGGER